MKYKVQPPSTKSQAAFWAWLPSTWPPAPAKFEPTFAGTLKKIFDESMLGEIRNVIDDIMKSNRGLHFRGHVVAISLMCALDAVSTCGYPEFFAIQICFEYVSDNRRRSPLS